jgi:hypothetical protein
MRQALAGCQRGADDSTIEIPALSRRTTAGLLEEASVPVQAVSIRTPILIVRLKYLTFSDLVMFPPQLKAGKAAGHT